MIGYALVGTNEPERARAFFDAVFAELGVKRLMDYGDTTYWGDGFTAGTVGICRPFDKQAASVGNGTMIALKAPGRAAVDSAYAKALSLGSVSEGKPGVRAGEGESAFYAAYFRDLDGNKFSVFHIGEG
ncbi:VOC family protein [Sphingomonas sp. ID0503]|uniref:VOC family protein n=1 Tax=Sphingomonas sp. ID0503 TaxID=3399691 RepID=UPI003AFB47DC